MAAVNTSYLYDELLKLLGGNRVVGAQGMDYGDWSPNNLRSLILTKNGFIAVYHTPYGGKMFKMHPLTEALSMAAITSARPSNPYRVLQLKQFSTLEEVIVDQALMRFSPAPLLETTYRLRQIVATPTTYAEISAAVSRHYARPAEGVRELLSDFLPEKEFMWARPADDNFELSYQLVPRVYSADKTVLKKHFDVVVTDAGLRVPSGVLDTSDKALKSAIQEDARSAKLVFEYCTIFMGMKRPGDPEKLDPNKHSALDEAYRRAFNPEGIVSDKFGGLPPGAHEMYAPIDSMLSKTGTADRPAKSPNGYINVEALRKRLSNLARTARSEEFPLPAKASDLLHWLNGYRTHWTGNSAGPLARHEERKANALDAPAFEAEPAVLESDDALFVPPVLEAPPLSAISETEEDDAEYGETDTLSIASADGSDVVPAILGDLATLYADAKKRAPVFAMYFQMLAETDPLDGSRRISKLKNPELVDFLRTMGYSNTRSVDLSDVRGVLLSDVDGFLGQLLWVSAQRKGVADPGLPAQPPLSPSQRVEAVTLIRSLENLK